MQHFRDSQTGAVYSFDDDVHVAPLVGGGFEFFAPGELTPLAGPYPTTLVRTDDPTPPPYVPTLGEMQSERDARLGAAALRIAPLQDAADLGEATAAESAALLDWKRYRVALNRLDLSVSPVQWPLEPA